LNSFLTAYSTFELLLCEKVVQENTTRAAVYRRLSFALLTKNSAELRVAVAQELEIAEEFLSTVEGLREAIEWHSAEIKLLRSAEARILTALSDTYPEAVEKAQPDTATRDEVLRAAVIFDEREIPIKPSNIVGIHSAAPHSDSRQAWMQLYDGLTSDQVEAIFTLCGYEISPTG
jgi:hypothetical protein